MKFQHELWRHIFGFFDFEDVYKSIVGRCSDNDWIVEVGSYLGKSACCLGNIIHNSGKSIKVLCVDPWPLRYTSDNKFVVDSFTIFCMNVKQSGWDRMIFPLRMRSSMASQIVKSGLAAVYIDGDHAFASVVEDIKCWMPKVRKGGILAGHDYSPGWPDVKKAVDQTLGPNIRTMGQSWIYDV